MLDNYLTKITFPYRTANIHGEYAGEYQRFKINQGDELTVSMITNIPYMYLMNDTLAIFKRQFNNLNSYSYYFVTANYETSELSVIDNSGLTRLVNLFVSLHSQCPYVTEYLSEVERKVSNRPHLIKSCYNGRSFI